MFTDGEVLSYKNNNSSNEKRLEINFHPPFHQWVRTSTFFKIFFVNKALIVIFYRHCLLLLLPVWSKTIAWKFRLFFFLFENQYRKNKGYWKNVLPAHPLTILLLVRLWIRLPQFHKEIETTELELVRIFCEAFTCSSEDTPVIDSRSMPAAATRGGINILQTFIGALFPDCIYS